MRTNFQLASILLLSGCGVPSNPEKGPVVLLCEGEHYLKAGNGETERQTLTRFYKVDGIERTLEEWDVDKQTWMGNPARIIITPNQITRNNEPSEMAGIISSKTVTIDRVAGRVRDEFSMSNGGMMTFEGTCKPVNGPTSEKKF